MIWRFIYSGSNTGKYNMDYDLELAKTISPDKTVVRFYRWKPYCISLGANQEMSSVNIKSAEQDNIDIVKRPTGGRAILHAEEITYSVVQHISVGVSPREIYHSINLALIEGLKLYDNRLAQTELETVQPDFSKFYKEDVSALCFAVPAKSELKFKGKKLAGSAQRKLGSSLLQHGSVLCGPLHKKITAYINVNPESLANISEELEHNTIDLSDITKAEIDYEQLVYCLTEGFIKHFLLTDYQLDSSIEKLKQTVSC